MDKEFLLQLSRRTALFSGVFCIIVSLVLLFNYLQFTSREPLETGAMQALIERLAEDPRNEQLKEDIRNLDLLARKAYFSSQWQIRTGSYLLLFGAILFAVSLRYYHSLKAQIEQPEEKRQSLFRGGIITQRWILGTGSVLVLVAIITSFLSVNHLERYEKITAAAPGTQPQMTEDIEVIDLSSRPGGEISAEAVEEPGSESSQAVQAETEQVDDRPSGEDPAEFTKTIPSSTVQAGSFPGYEEIMAQHNSFRGAWGNGISAHKNIPVSWDGVSGEGIIWKTEILKPGYNSPVIWDDLLFLSGADEQSQVVFCYDRHTGTLKWQAETGDIPGSPAEKPRVTEDTGLAAPGLATDGSRVYAIFATGDVVCFSMDGTRLWARNLGVPDNHYGHSSSLLVWKDKLFIQYDSNRGGRLLALNVLTGETVWDTRRNTVISWASPLLVEHKGNIQLVLSADPLVAGYDIHSGEELWSVDCMMGEVGPSPAYSEGLVFAANEYAVLAAIDLDNPTATFWENNEYLPEVASPVASEGLLFIATSYGVLACYDARTGELLWEQEFGYGFYSSPMVADGRLYIMDTGGIMHIISISREFNLVGEAALGEKAYSTPAFASGRIYIRGATHLYCIGS